MKDLVEQEDRPDEEMHRVRQKGRGSLFVGGVADALEDPADDERREADAPVRDPERGEIENERSAIATSTLDEVANSAQARDRLK